MQSCLRAWNHYNVRFTTKTRRKRRKQKQNRQNCFKLSVDFKFVLGIYVSYACTGLTSNQMNDWKRYKLKAVSVSEDWIREGLNSFLLGINVQAPFFRRKYVVKISRVFSQTRRQEMRGFWHFVKRYIEPESKLSLCQYWKEDLEVFHYPPFLCSLCRGSIAFWQIQDF